MIQVFSQDSEASVVRERSATSRRRTSGGRAIWRCAATQGFPRPVVPCCRTAGSPSTACCGCVIRLKLMTWKVSAGVGGGKELRAPGCMRRGSRPGGPQAGGLRGARRAMAADCECEGRRAGEHPSVRCDHLQPGRTLAIRGAYSGLLDRSPARITKQGTVGRGSRHYGPMRLNSMKADAGRWGSSTGIASCRARTLCERMRVPGARFATHRQPARRSSGFRPLHARSPSVRPARLLRHG